MAITKRPDPRKAAAIDQFIGGAPDAAASESSSQVEPARAPGRRKKETISLGIDPALLARVDAAADHLGISRAAAFAMAAARFVDAEGA
ncbi:hypothetical protein DF011_20445 [Burkholderia ubonensis]|nr:hypothetical protein CJO70_09110 [Burkholderia ubonensis]PAJ97757.1 hypothetical protein CJO68_29915 [Burkholderia ubonensis]PAK08152.1 hypothetical protein CJO67_09350 [Burkholderia ubonensis]RQP80347.1 hypothetical protein DF014_21360 [Burkholderia ubonensis]RQP99635.1 hypothetical protein DF012_08010 [Burkholderia ubonensis]